SGCGFGCWVVSEMSGPPHRCSIALRTDGGHSVVADANVRHAVAAGAFIDRAPRIMLDNGVVEAATLEQSIGIGAKQPVLITRDGLALNIRRSSAFLPVHGLPPAAFTASFARVRLT